MDFVNNLILLISGQGIVLAFFIFLKDRSKRNRWISSYIFTFSGILIYWYFTFWSPTSDPVLRIFRGDLFLHLFLGPMLFMALEPISKWKNHFIIPGALGVLFWGFWIFLYNYLVTNQTWEGLGFTYSIYLYINFISLVPCIWYLYRARAYFNSRPNKLLILSLGAYLLGWTGSHVMALTTGYIALIDYTLVFTEIFFFYSTGYFILIGSKKPGYKVESNELDKIISDISDMMKTDRPFLDPNFTLQSMSESLNIHSKKLSHVINQGFGQGFSEYVNSHRIEEAKKLLISDSYQKHTVLEILMECGFNSKSAFNAAFKKHTGQSPLQFKKAAIPVS